jgi:hypothetical protein
MANKLPMPIRSLALLAQEPVAAALLPLQAAGTTYSMAQEATFIDETYYAVGRWDGTLSLFAFTDSPTQGPVIAAAVNSPAQEGLQMIVALSPAAAFASSNDEQSLLIWATSSGNWADLEVAVRLEFDASLGVANSGAAVQSAGAPCLAIGHANGFVSIWRRGASIADWTCASVTDVRAAKPVNPWDLHNVRGVAALALGDGQGYVVTGSEDGNLTVLRVADGAIMSATVYNPAAQRGINSLAVVGSALLVANCAVGAADSNLWSFVIDPADWSVTLADKAILRIDPNAPQVFNFDFAFTELDGGPSWFFCSTQEGALWMGKVDAGAGLSILGYEKVGAAALGSAVCASGIRVAVTAYDLHEYLIS